ncbi:MAG: heavy metal translocating P-type ATPase [Caldimicrobium sp.]|nr:heavy metal translocating P-type ATPase [Caldimicrobium sp.]MCX7873958.1 heavy metal translocating P-type ATPase [Caldimicrobium sp.]MDW8094203.1 heavy metal translocating P-type ATPase metal-binding domain-containing protein [Caldimicrobium sp.]
MSERKISCVHCLTPILEKEALWYEINGDREPYCCQGCFAIRKAIKEANLEEFYIKRRDWVPGQPEFKKVEPQLFESCIREINRDEKELKIGISGIRCAACIWLLERFLRKKRGIRGISINFATHRATIRYNPQEITLEEILESITILGYLPLPGITSDLERILESEAKDLLIRFGTASFFSMQLMLYTVSLYAGYFQGIEASLRKLFEYLAWGLSTPVMFYSAQPFWKNFFKSMLSRHLSMDVLVIMGSFSAYTYSVVAIFMGKEVYFDTSAMIITFILLGRYLEKKMQLKASSVLRILLSYQPKYATKITSSGEILSLVESLKSGDLVVIKPGEKIPVDGTIVEGISEVDESLLTGEPMPVTRREGDKVYAGCMNINGKIIIKVQDVKETLLSKIVQTVLKALEEKPRLQGIADRVIRVFVPLVVLIACITFIYGYIQENLTEGLLRAVSVLVIACPCALGLALPLAFLIATQKAYQLGLLIRDGTLIERVNSINIIAFDKTGTLTKGEPQVKEYHIYEEPVNIVLQIALSLESCSTHPLAKAFLKLGNREEVYKVTDFKNYPGRGIEGVIDGGRYYLGNREFIEERIGKLNPQVKQMCSFYVQAGYTVVMLSDEKRVLGLFVLDDTLREEAKEVIEELKRKRLKTWILSGDEEEVVKRVARELKIDYSVSKATPIEKAEIIKEWQNRGKRIMMIGDGINDAPALAVSTASLALASGVELAMESAQGVFMKKDLRILPEFLSLAKRTLKIAKENLLWAFSYNIIAIPLAVTGKIHPVISALLMATSSILVVINSLRLAR